jgi:hypothetical protein
MGCNIKWKEEFRSRAEFEICVAFRDPVGPIHSGLPSFSEVICNRCRMLFLYIVCCRSSPSIRSIFHQNYINSNVLLIISAVSIVNILVFKS